jgi:ankyrin repeat protein
MALLARHGADLNASWRGYRPLHALIQEEPHKNREPPSTARISCLKWLLAHGADPDLTGAFPPARALLTAAFVGESVYVRELRAAGATINVFVEAALGNVRSVKTRLAKDLSMALARDEGGLTALQSAAASRMGARDPKIRRALLQVATLLLDAGADPNARTKGWAHELDVTYFAASSGQRDVFELLLARGADATAALPSAAWQKDDALAESALRFGARPDEARADGKPLLNQLIQWGQVRAALWLLEHGASPNVPDPSGWTAMHQAASRGNERVLRALIDVGGDLSRRDTWGLSPRDVAQAGGRAKILALVLGPARADPAAATAVPRERQDER